GSSQSDIFPNIIGVGVVTNGGSDDAIIFKFDNNGVSIWGTLVGGVNNDVAWGLDVKTNSDIYLCVESSSPSLPQAANSLQGNFDGFALRLSSTGILSFSRFIGGNFDDYAKDIAIDGNDN